MIAFASRLVRRILMGFVRAYQVAVSPLLPPSCRFIPSCSNYALEVLEHKSLLEGLWLIVWRLCRCQPLCRGGFDPVPPDRTGPENAAQFRQAVGAVHELPLRTTDGSRLPPRVDD